MVDRIPWHLMSLTRTDYRMVRISFQLIPGKNRSSQTLFRCMYICYSISLIRNHQIYKHMDGFHDIHSYEWHSTVELYVAQQTWDTADHLLSVSIWRMQDQILPTAPSDTYISGGVAEIYWKLSICRRVHVTEDIIASRTANRRTRSSCRCLRWAAPISKRIWQALLGCSKRKSWIVKGQIS